MKSLNLQLVDYRVEFSKWWVSEFKTVKFPSQATVFDYFIDAETKKWTPWAEKVPKYEHDPEMPLQVKQRERMDIVHVHVEHARYKSE